MGSVMAARTFASLFTGGGLADVGAKQAGYKLMTPRALARMQSVPDWYVLPGKVALACKIIGNGVPCLMMQRIMESFS
jgi:site-specific DNA-cytosine methylase